MATFIVKVSAIARTEIEVDAKNSAQAKVVAKDLIDIEDFELDTESIVCNI